MDKKRLFIIADLGVGGTRQNIQRILHRYHIGDRIQRPRKGNQEMEKKAIILVGGVGDKMKNSKQFRNQYRVYERKVSATSITACGINGLYIRRFRKDGI